MKVWSVLLCVVLSGSEALSQTIEPSSQPASQSEVVSEPSLPANILSEPDAQKRNAWYLGSGVSLGVSLLGLIVSQAVTSEVDRHLFEEDTPQDLNALRTMQAAALTKELAINGSIGALTMGRYYQTKKPRTFLLSSVALGAFSFLSLSTAVGIGLGNDTAELPSANTLVFSNTVSSITAASLSLGAATTGVSLLVRKSRIERGVLKVKEAPCQEPEHNH